MKALWMCALLAACGAAACGAPAGDTSASRALDTTTAGGEVRGASTVLEDSALDGRLRVPDGFKVDYFARLRGVRFMALGPDGAVYASQSGAGQVTRLADRNGDGVADDSTVAVSGLNRPHGLAFHKGYLYIANTDGVVRVRLGEDGRATGAPERLTRYAGGGGHWSRTIVFGADGAMYVSIGSSCNICAEEDRALVMRYDENGNDGRIYAKGLRNAVGLAVHPTTRQLWASTHERDNLRPEHEDLPPEEIDILQDGGDYGFPYCWGNRHPNPEFKAEGAKRCPSTIPPALELQAHSAPLGLAFLAGASKFPRDYQGDALLAFHGSWNRSTPTGAKVVRIRVKDGKPASYEDFITGWQRPDGSRWGRPVDVLVHRDGSVLVSDDAGGAIYRVWR